MEDAWLPDHNRKYHAHNMMNNIKPFPIFDECFSDLNQFILELVEMYETGKIQSWHELEAETEAYFTPQRMEQMESRVPGWQKMASYSGGITLVHVTCVFLGLFMLPEFRNLTSEQKQLAKWIVLFHDIDKFHIKGKKDTMHAFRSAVSAANTLRRFGFPANEKYEDLIGPWSQLTLHAFLDDNRDGPPIPDNQKLPGILIGIDRLYGENTPGALIIKTILFHISLDVGPIYPTPAPLTEDEIQSYLNASLLPLMKVMMLADNEGWAIFEPEDRKMLRNLTLAMFQKVEKIVGTHEAR